MNYILYQHFRHRLEMVKGLILILSNEIQLHEYSLYLSPYRCAVGLLLLNSSLIASQTTMSITKGIRTNFKCYHCLQDIGFKRNQSAFK